MHLLIIQYQDIIEHEYVFRDAKMILQGQKNNTDKITRNTQWNIEARKQTINKYLANQPVYVSPLFIQQKTFLRFLHRFHIRGATRRSKPESYVRPDEWG